MIGQKLAHYKIVEKLGEGGMGEVYRARDTKLDRDVALKVLPEELAQDPDRRKRFEREAKAVAALRHPNIVMIHSVEEVDGVHFITMELVEGETLTDVIPEDGLKITRFFDYAIALADSLAAAHAKGIAHRDLKPANIMIDADGRLRVLDFGLAKLFESNVETDKTLAADTETGAGQILGTAAYMSPEQAEGEPIDHRSDVFSLGIILYEMATGKRPFRGKTSISTISAILKEEPPSVTDVKRSLPRHLGRIVKHCLAKEPDRRYQSVLDVRNALEGLKSEVTSGEHNVPAVKRSSGGVISKRVWQIGGIAVAAIVAIAAIVMLRPRGEDTPTDGPATSPQVASTPSSPGPNAGVPSDQSIAVLPFANMSQDPNNEFFSDGLAEELLNLLARVPGLRVAARTSSFHFKGHTGNVTEVAKQLNVATILEGSVRRAGDRVRITAQLVKADDGFHMWSETYDRQLDDIFAIQEEIATRVVDALKITLLGEAAAQLAKRPTDNVEAYDAYLLGQQRMARRRTDSLEEALEYYKQATALDPHFAQAYAQMAATYLLLNDYGSLRLDEATALAADMIGRALEIDDQLGDAYAALGLLKANKGEPDAAEEAYQRAIELNPNHALAYMWYSLVKAGTDRAKAWELLHKSLELDPLAPTANVNVGYWLMQDGKPEEALAQFRHVTEIDPGFVAAYNGMALAYQDHLDQPEEALRWFRKCVEIDPGSLQRRIELGRAYDNLGRNEDAVEAFRQTIDVDPGFAPAYEAMGDIHWRSGHLADAVRWIKKAVDRDRDNMGMQWRMFRLYLDLDDVKSAEIWLDRLKKSHPDSPFPNVAHAALYEYRGDIDRAETLFRETAEARPQWFRNRLAFYDLMHGRVEDARGRYETSHRDLLQGDDPVINGSNLYDAIDICYTLQQPEDRSRRDMLLRKSEDFLLSRSEPVRRNRYQWQLYEIRVLQGRIDEALRMAEQLVADGRVAGWWERVDPASRLVLDNPGRQAMVAKIRTDVAEIRRELAAEGLATN